MNNTTPEQALPLGVSDFAGLRQDGMIYVDKTEMIARMAATRKGKFFLARPRRFGKSLLISTFESLFKHGLRDFHGLAIEKLWQEQTYDTIRLDFSKLKEFSDVSDFESKLGVFLSDALEVSLGVHLQAVNDARLINEFDKWLGKRPTSSVVLLIDEYDAPLTACLDQPELFEKVRKTLASFYAILKSNDGALRFLFITGITKYSKMSIFSELNNLNYITLYVEYVTLLVYTTE